MLNAPSGLGHVEDSSFSKRLFSSCALMICPFSNCHFRNVPDSYASACIRIVMLQLSHNQSVIE